MGRGPEQLPPILVPDTVTTEQYIRALDRLDRFRRKGFEDFRSYGQLKRLLRKVGPSMHAFILTNGVLQEVEDTPGKKVQRYAIRRATDEGESEILSATTNGALMRVEKFSSGGSMLTAVYTIAVPTDVRYFTATAHVEATEHLSYGGARTHAPAKNPGDQFHVNYYTRVLHTAVGDLLQEYRDPTPTSALPPVRSSWWRRLDD